MNRLSDPRGRDSILHESSQAHDRDGQNFAQPPTPPPGDAAWLAIIPLSEIFGRKIFVNAGHHRRLYCNAAESSHRLQGMTCSVSVMHRQRSSLGQIAVSHGRS